jgi:hypothetical protein
VQGSGASQLREALESARISAEATRRQAKLAFLGSIITSVVAAIVAISVAIGSFLGASANEAQKARDDFIRPKQFELYAKVVKDEQTWFDAKKVHLRLGKQRPSLPNATVHKAAVRANDAENTFRENGSHVEDLFSSTVKDKFDETWKTNARYRHAVDEYLTELGEGQNCDTLSCEAAFNDSTSAEKLVDDSKTVLTRAFIDDLMK